VYEREEAQQTASNRPTSGKPEEYAREVEKRITKSAARTCYRAPTNSNG
jgi:hypothetical protein